MTQQLSGGGALVAALAVHGVDTVFGIPGTHNLAAFAAMAGHGIRNVLPRHEQGAGYAADGYARSTGRPGVVLTTTGPAILNTAAAAAQAYSDSVPVLFVSPGMPLRHPGLGNGLLHETKDQTAALAAVVSYAHRVTSVEEIPLAIAQAFARMRSGRPRPVHIEIPLDLFDAQAGVELVGPVQPAVAVPDGAILDRAAERLKAATAPVIIAGGGANSARENLRVAAEALGAPVVATANGKGILPEDHPLSVGAGVQHRSVLDMIDASDVVLAVGTELAPADWWLGLPDLAGKLVRLDVDPAGIVTNAVPAVAVVGDAAEALAGLTGRLGGRPGGSAERAARWRERFAADARTEGAAWTDIIAAIAESLPRDAVLAADSAMACYYGALSNLPLHRERSFLYPTGGGTLGYGLPAGIGAKVASPQTAVLVLQGDGGAMFTIAELATAAEQGLALPVVIVDNGGYGEIHNEMLDRGEPVGSVALGHPDFVALARSLGCHGVHAAAPPDLVGAIKTALAANRPTLIHVVESSRASQGLRPS